MGVLLQNRYAGAELGAVIVNAVGAMADAIAPMNAWAIEGFRHALEQYPKVVEKTCCFFSTVSNEPIVSELEALLRPAVPNRFEMYMCFRRRECSMIADLSPGHNQGLDRLFWSFWFNCMTGFEPEHSVAFKRLVDVADQISPLTEVRFNELVKQLNEKVTVARRARIAETIEYTG